MYAVAPLTSANSTSTEPGSRVRRVWVTQLRAYGARSGWASTSSAFVTSVSRDSANRDRTSRSASTCRVNTRQH